MMVKLALQAALWYNNLMKCCCPPRGWHLRGLYICVGDAPMTSIPPHCILIPLYKQTDNYTIISPDDSDLALSHRWILNSRYVRAGNCETGTNVLLHRIVMERKLGRPIGLGMYVDHINGDPLDNRRCNLREVTPTQNQFNKRRQKQSASGYKGVIHDRHWATKPWVARIRHDGVREDLGHFVTAEEAARAYDEKAKLYHRGYAKLNFPECLEVLCE